MHAHGASPYLEKPYYALALDPIHVGTGGYRLGEVDMTIVREPGSHLPKLPGSSLEGAARAYTAMAADRYRREQHFDAEARTIRYVSCAGKGGDHGEAHCGEMDCPVCTSYGFTIGTAPNRSFHGLAQFYDARPLFFPVHTMVGPLWVTSPAALAGAGYTLPDAQQPPAGQVRAVKGLVRRVSGSRWGVNCGWLFLEIAGDDLDVAAIWQALDLPPALAKVRGRLLLLPDKLFGVVVNGNLEVRTSVSIDPATGAAEEGALFTYEATPRGTVFHFPIVYHNPHHYLFPTVTEGKVDPRPFPDAHDAAWVRANVERGLRLMAHLGVGGMNTRGFGRLRILNLEVDDES